MITFHYLSFRDLEYIIHIRGLDNDKEFCEYSLVQELTSSIYLNLDQLNDLKKFNKLYSYVSSYIDVELPKSKATSNTVFFFGIPKELNAIKVPIHYRYQSVGYRK